MSVQKFLAVLTAGLVVGCGEDESNPSTNQALTLNFQSVVGDQDFACDQVFEDIGTNASSLTITDNRLYISNIRVVDDAGVEHPLELEQDGVWQFEDVVLLDFEDGTGNCTNGNEPTNFQAVGTTSATSFAGVVFDLGIPESLNHSDSAIMPSPLNLTSMWWSWQGGYKFVRIEGSTSELDGWRLHLGSTACTGDPGSEISCSNKNRPEIRLEGGVDADPILFDIAELLKASDLSQDAGGAVGCMAGPEDPECAPLFETLGITGTQSAFRF